MENSMLRVRLMIHTIYEFSLPADTFPFAFTGTEEDASFVVSCVVKEWIYIW